MRLPPFDLPVNILRATDMPGFSSEAALIDEVRERLLSHREQLTLGGVVGIVLNAPGPGQPPGQPTVPLVAHK